jgi:hypothetical protein
LITVALAAEPRIWRGTFLEQDWKEEFCALIESKLYQKIRMIELEMNRPSNCVLG